MLERRCWNSPTWRKVGGPGAEDGEMGSHRVVWDGGKHREDDLGDDIKMRQKPRKNAVLY